MNDKQKAEQALKSIDEGIKEFRHNLIGEFVCLIMVGIVLVSIISPYKYLKILGISFQIVTMLVCAKEVSKQVKMYQSMKTTKRNCDLIWNIIKDAPMLETATDEIQDSEKEGTD